MRPDLVLSDRTIGLIREIAGRPAGDFCTLRLIPQLVKLTGGPSSAEEFAKTLGDPIASLRALLGFYAFSRRGKDRKVYSSIAEESLVLHIGDVGSEAFLSSPNASGLWDAFVSECETKGKKPMPDLNIGVVAGLAELAQEVYQNGDISIATKIAHDATVPGELEETFLRLVDIRGVGPKLASTIVRDFVVLLGVEDKVRPKDVIYAQPIDRWLRRASRHILESEDTASLADWVLAGKLGRAARLAGVSPVRLNMGVEGIGMNAFSWNDPDDWFDEEIENLKRRAEGAHGQSATHLTSS